MTSSQDNAWNTLLLPRELFGTHREVIRACKPIVSRAWKEGTWANVEEELQFVEAYTMCDGLMLSWPHCRNEIPYWRTYGLSEVLSDVSMSDDSTDSFAMKLEKKHELICDGMPRLWFTLCCLASGDGGIFPDAPDRKTRRNRGSRYLELIVSHIPELEALTLRMRDDWFGIRELSMKDMPSIWGATLLAAACWAGHNTSYELVCERFKGDVLSALLSGGVLSRVGNRYEVSTT